MLVSVVLTLAVGGFLVRRSLERTALGNLARQARLVALRQENAPVADRPLRSLRGFLSTQNVTLLLPPLPLTEGSVPGLPGSAVEAVNAGRSAQGRTTGGPRGTLLFAAEPAGTSAVVLLRPARIAAADWRPYLGSLVLAGLAGAVVAAVASLLLARTIARPVRRVAEASRELAEGRRPGQLPVEGYDELALLSASFNDMAAQLERARRAEQQFLLSVSHELKTPLTAIRGYAEGLEEGAVDPVEAGTILTREAARLELLVQDLLDLARTSQPGFTVRRETIDMAEVAAEAVRRYGPRVRAFDVRLNLEPAGQPAPAIGDPDRVLQVVSNLVENALRCTPAGGSVTVAAGPGPEVSVADTGPGLDPEDLPRAFERFFLYRRYGGERPVGTGLGLALVKDLTEAMDGSVTVESAEGQGTLFTVRLPGPDPATGLQVGRAAGAAVPDRPDTMPG